MMPLAGAVFGPRRYEETRSAHRLLFRKTHSSGGFMHTTENDSY